ncbi:MAG TPA: hypothetical protein VGN97_12305 [Mesorhizobium sp.]|jgi:hypothetical protein|nr:hypothetical protein [Mesorhizobium sp.]
MTDEVVVSSGQVLSIGTDEWEIVGDTDLPVQFVDLITEARHLNGVVYLSFASGVVDANNTGRAHMACRLRMSLGTAQGLHHLLGDMISTALKPIDPSTTN